MLRKEDKHFEQHSIHQIFGKNLTRLLALSLFSLNTLADISSNELPQGADIVSGDITINSNDNVMNIDQDSQQGIIDWQTFNVGSDATVNFNQPNSSASTLNRVVTDNASQIYGNINANGQVLLVNSSGVYISENGRVETGGIVATTQEINNQEYLDNPDRIILRETDQSGSIENHGTVIANEAYVAMLAPEVQNEGLITANMGEVVLASGREIILSFNDGQITDVITTPSLLNSLIENKLAIEAAGGKVILSATAMNQINGGLINQAGSINVGSTETVAVNEGGRIYLTSNEVVFDGGSQTLANADTQGGEIEVAANDITIEGDARIEASATLNGDGGRIDLVAQNDMTINGVIKADGADEGVGGEILTQGEQVILENNAQISAKSGENAPIIQENNIKILENAEIVAQNSNQGNWRIVSAASVWTQTHASVIELALLNANVSETVNADLCVTNCSSDQVGDLMIGDDINLNNRSTTLTQLELTASDYLSLQGTINDEHQNLILEATGFRGLSLGTVADITANQVSFRSEEQIDVLGSVITTGNENTNPLANFIGANMVMAGLIQTSNQTRLGRIVMTALNQINLRPESKVLANGDAGGTVLINARHIDVDGFIQSNGGTGRGGTITLDIEKTVDMNQAWIESNGFDAGGTIKIQVRDGPLNMDATRIQTNASNGRGGTILISGREHTHITSSHIESKGTSQGGEIYLGYDQDNQRIPFSKYLYISKNTIVDARNFNNTNGGFVETSGHVVNILATINVGRGGMWLIDPFDVTISNAASGDPYSANFDPTQTTILNASSIEGSLNSGTDVSITTGSATANTLTVDFSIQPKSYSGATLTLTGGTIDINKDITGDGVDLNLVLNGATIDIDNSISLGGGNLTINASSSGDISSSYSITAQNIIKSGSGDFTVNSSSTISGDVTINAGAIIMAAATPFGDQDINVNSGGTLNFNNINYGGKGSINLNGGTLSASGGTSTLSNDSAINLLANSTIDVASSAELTLSGVISGGYAITKTGAGTLTLSANNSFTHGLNVNAGTVSVSAVQFGLVNNINFDLVIANGATFIASGNDIFANNQTQIISTVEIQSGGTMTNGGNFFSRIGNLTLSGGTLTSTGGITSNDLSDSVAWTLSETVTATADSTISGSAEIFNGHGGNGVNFSVSDGATLTVSASLIDGDDSTWSGTGLATGFSKNGLGTLLLSGTNEVSSTIAINLGTLEISGTIHTLGESSTDSYVTFSQAIANSGALVLNQDTVNQRLQGIISGTGTLTQQGDNQVVLTATNTYSGSTTISSGSIKLGNLTSSGSIDSSSIINNANLVIDRSTSATIASDISGTGTLNIIYRLEELINWESSDSLLDTYEKIAANATVLDILNRISGGQVHGESILDGVQKVSGAGVYEKTYDADNETASMWFRWNSGSNYTKQVNILLRQNGTDVEAASTSRQWVSSPSSDYDRLDENDMITSVTGSEDASGLATDQDAVGYGVRSIDLNVKISLSGNLTYTGATTLHETDADQSGDGSAYWRTFYKDSVEFTNTGDIGAVSNAGNLAVASDASFEIGGIISGIGTVRKSGSGTLTLSAVNTFTNDIHITGGTLSVTGQLESGTYDGLITNAGTLSIATNSNQTLSGVISGSGSLTKSGSGTLTLSGTNTFSGTVNISAGSLAISNSRALGTTSGNTTVSDGATLQISGEITVAENMYVNGSGVSSNGAVYFLSGNNTYSGAIVLQSNTTMTSAAGNQTLGTVISGTGTINGAYDLTITAAGNWSQLGVIGGSSALADFSLTASTGNVSTNFITASGSINIFGVDVSQDYGTSITAGNNEDIIISATGDYSIAYGSASNALVTSGTGRWIVYTADDDDNSNFGDRSNGYLNSNNTPLWGATYSTLAPASVPSGNRYVFAETSSQTVTFTTTSETITYADSYDLSDNYLITTSGVAGLENVYDITSSGSQITLETAYSSNPTVTISANSGSNSTSGNLVAGSYTLGISVAGGTLRSGYTLATSETGSITVNQKALTVSGITAANKTYDGDNTATIDYSSAVFTGLVSGDTVTVTATGTFTDANVGTGKTVTLSETTGGADEGNYSITTQGTTTANITAKALTYTVDAADKTYDGTDAATVTITLSGLVGAETLTTTETSTFAQTTVATGITVTVDSISLVDGTGDADNYTISSGQTDTAAITAKTLTATAAAADKTYDGTTTATVTLTLSGVVGSDSVSSTNGATFSQSNVGTGLTATVNSITLTGDDADNYTISSGQTDTAAITAKALTYTVDASNKTYDGTDAATVTITLSGLVGAETLTASAIATFDSANVGTRTATVNSITLADGTGDADNYSISTGGTDSASITQKALTYTVDASDKTYDGTNSATATLSLTGLVGSETLGVTNTATFANANAGDDKTVTVTSVNLADGTNGGLAANYSISSGETTTATINKATLNVAPLDDAKFVGEADPAGYNGVIYNGFISGESSSDLGGSTTLSRNAGETAGDYILSLTQTLTSDNYTINYGTGTFTIAATTAILVDLVQNNTLYYGSDPTYGAGQSHTVSARDIDGALTVTMSGQEATITKSGTTVAVAPLVPNAATSSTAGYYEVGGYNYSVDTADANYSLADGYSIIVDSGEYNITPLEIDVNATVTVGGLTKTYDGNANISGLTTTISSSPVKTGDDVIFAATGTFDSRHVGTSKTVSISMAISGDDANNYSLSNNSISSNTGTITQLNSVTWLGSAGDGLWATASNWANGAIPDQSNVATVIIPDGSTVNYQYDVLGQIGSAITNNGDLTLSGTTDFTFSNDVAGDGTIIFDADQVGDTLTLSGTSTMSGTVNIQEHTAIIAASNALGTATLRANDGYFSVSSGVTMNQLTTAGLINLTSDLNTNGDIIFGGNLVIAGGNGTDANNLDPLEINSNNNDITFNGKVTAGSASKANFRSLTIDAGTGEVNINERFGYAFNGVTYSNLTSTNLWQLNVTAAAINLRADVMTFERQTYNGAMFVGDNGTNGLTRILLSVDPEVIINGTVDDLDPNPTHTLVTKAVSLNTDVPVVNVTGEVGATNALVNWIAATGRQNTAEEWGNITTGTSGTLTYQGDAISGGAQTLAASEQSGYVAPANTTTTTDSRAQDAGSIAGRFKQAYQNIVSNTTEKFREIRQKTMIGIGVKILDENRDCDASGANDCKSTITIRGMLDQLIRKLWIRFA